MINEDVTNSDFITYTSNELEILQSLPAMCQFLYQKIKESGKMNWWTGVYVYSNYIEWAAHLNKIQILNGYNLQKLRFTRKTVSTIITILEDCNLIERVPNRKNTLRLLHIRLAKPKVDEIKKVSVKKKIYKKKNEDDVPLRFFDKNLVL